MTGMFFSASGYYVVEKKKRDQPYPNEIEIRHWTEFDSGYTGHDLETPMSMRWNDVDKTERPDSRMNQNLVEMNLKCDLHLANSKAIDREITSKQINKDANIPSHIIVLSRHCPSNVRWSPYQGPIYRGFTWAIIGCRLFNVINILFSDWYILFIIIQHLLHSILISV